MPRRNDIRSILVLGSGPIVIGQACEFDYSGTQACRVLREEGYRVVLANSNPATIMTDPDFADATYVEPLTVEVIEKIIEAERPDAVLPTLGGQTALNLAIALDEAGVLERFGVEMIGAKPLAIRTAEDRELFKEAMTEIGLSMPASGFAHTVGEALDVADGVGYPIIVRPSFILGGKGTGFAGDRNELHKVATEGLAASPISEILIERSIKGWKEYELEVMRDTADNCVVVCSIENLDPMGVHTGDSITVAPAMTLSDVEYQQMRDASFAVMRRIGVETGGSNVQFAVDPETGHQVVIEMNPRVSRSSALASKATGFPIAKIAARLAVGYTLDEITNDITKATPASFEPTIDYVVTKVPRWAFEKLPGTEPVLGTRMQAVGEVMAIGRIFTESLQKALASLEWGRAGLGVDRGEAATDAMDDDELLAACAVPTPDRIFQLGAALSRGLSVEQVQEATGVDPWFLDQMAAIAEERHHLAGLDPTTLDRGGWRRAKRLGFTDAQLGYLWDRPELEIRALRTAAGVVATFKTVDTCGAEFEATTPYHYSTYEDAGPTDGDEVIATGHPRVVILGSGPNRIGQGIEFDYCCVHASFALSEAGIESVMVNCNPETVSTDYDTSDRLYFEPLTLEHVLNVLEREAADGELLGVIVSLGGQTPLKLAHGIEEAGYRVLGTTPDAIDSAEDRQHWADLCSRLAIPQPAGGTAASTDEALAITNRIGYPALIRPSYVLGGRAMRIVYDDDQLRGAMDELSNFAALGREGGLTSDRPVLIDRFLEDATECDVDAVRDHTGDVVIGGIMEHIEEAGIHSGDSACALPPFDLHPFVLDVLGDYTRAIAAELGVIGLLNVQYAVKDGQVFVIEANPRASRTVPFVAKATGVAMARVATRVMAGATLSELRQLGVLRHPVTGPVAIKEAVLPFDRFPDVDSLLGPEMRSTGEVMGIDGNFGMAFAKAQMGAGGSLPTEGAVFLSVADRDKPALLATARAFQTLDFEVVATAGTAAFLAAEGIPVNRTVGKVGDEPADGAVGETGRETAVDLIAGGRVQLVINTPHGRGERADGDYIRSACIVHHVPCLTTIAAARAAGAAIGQLRRGGLTVTPLQAFHERAGE